MSLFRKKEEPEPVLGTELSGKYEIEFSGKKDETFFGKLERVISEEFEAEGEKHEVNVYRFMAKKAGDEAFWLSVDEDISTEGEMITMKDTILGSKSLMRWSMILMVILDAVVMYLLYSFSTSGFQFQYSPSSAMTLSLIIISALVASILFLIYWWYSSKVTVFRIELRPLIEDYSSSLVPVYMKNSSRNPPEKYLLKMAKMSDAVFRALDQTVKLLSIERVTSLGRTVKEQESIIYDLKTTRVANVQNLKDVKAIERATSRTYSSYLPVIISIIVVAVGFLVMYLVYG
ncbi:MAG: hypothetical protein QW292_06535 [Candidatus Parvarchaeota archaeon]